MKTIYIDRGIEGGISEPMKAYAEKKLGFGEQFFGIKEIKLTIRSEKRGICVSASFIDRDNHHFYFSRFAADYYSAIDLLEDQIHDALEARKNRTPRRKSGMIQEEPVSIAREKLVVTSQMSLEEAHAEMDELGHSWFVFRDNNNDIAIMYERFDGSLGLMIVK